MPDLPSHFGPYEVGGPLGAGGMGQVYRARDTRLQRNVAIKLLLDSAALDADRRRRFAQEAIAASALNHPNILTVYDVGIEGDIPYLVSELIDGVSLRAEMNQGREPLKRIIDIAQQIAEGLAAAHEAGIVHRDLKPENVMVTRDGRVKIVDFGLAKTAEEEPALAAGPTATETAAGLIMGTVPYMSPEQARGDKADFRSDQFALGVMLYELTTANHPFRRDTAVQTLSAIITDDPPDPAQLNPSLPVPLRWLIRRLLAKKPRERYAHTADLAADLRTIREYLSEATSAMTTPVVARRRRWQIPAAVAAVLAGGFLLGRNTGSEDSGVRFDRYTPFATDAGYQGAPAWSPDGRQIVYEAEVNGVVQIFTKTLGSAVRAQVTNSIFDSKNPTWSSDGYIYYHRLAGQSEALWRVSPIGGTPEMLIEQATGSAISPDGKTVFFLREKTQAALAYTLWYSPLPAVHAQRYTRGAFGKLAGSSGYVRFSADGSRLLVWLGPDPGRSVNFWVIPMPDGEPEQVLPGLSRSGLAHAFFSWVPDNRHLIVTRSDGPTPGTHLWVADTRPQSTLASMLPWGTRAALSPLTPTPGNENSPSVSPDGRTIAFTSEATDYDLFEVPLDGSPLKPFPSSTRNEFDPAASPATTQFAFVTDRTGTKQIWLQNEEGYQQEPLVTEADFGGETSDAVGALAFSPNGERLAFQWADATGSRLWITPVAGGKPFTIASDTTFSDAPTWSPKGDWIAYLNAQEGSLKLVKSPVGGRAAPVILQTGIPAFVARPQWSPDGQWILCETFDGLSLVAADGSGSARVIGGTGWLAYAWDRDSRTAYGLRATDDEHHFALVSVDSKTQAERIINADLGSIPQALQPIRGFSRLRKGGFLTSVARVRSDIYLIEGFRLPGTWWQRLWGRRP
jgi:serine/threonine protein kinase